MKKDRSRVCAKCIEVLEILYRDKVAVLVTCPNCGVLHEKEDYDQFGSYSNVK